jgi:hypothetical protein
MQDASVNAGHARSSSTGASDSPLGSEVCDQSWCMPDEASSCPSTPAFGPTPTAAMQHEETPRESLLDTFEVRVVPHRKAGSGTN